MPRSPSPALRLVAAALLSGSATQATALRCGASSRHTAPLMVAPLRDRPPTQISAADAAANADAVLDGLEAHGVVRINSVLLPDVAATLLEHVNQELEEALLSAQESLVMDQDDVFAERFGKVLARQDRVTGATQRHDLKLALTPPVELAVSEILKTIGPALSESLGEDAVLYELAALISDPGSPQQPFHPDTPYRDDQGVAVLTAFVALQTIERDMGPTKFLPASHVKEAHAAFNGRGDDNSRASFDELLLSRPCFNGDLETGDATLFDSRCLHCGGANTSKRRRVLFYASFRARDAQAPRGTLMYDLREKHTLSALCHAPSVVGIV